MFKMLDSKIIGILFTTISYPTIFIERVLNTDEPQK